MTLGHFALQAGAPPVNLTQAMKHVLKHQGQSLLTIFLKEDLKQALMYLKDGLGHVLYSPTKKKRSLHEMKSTGLVAIELASVLPGRIKTAFLIFEQSFLDELEKIHSTRDKTLFCFEVIGALSSFSLGAMYELNKGRQLRHRALGHFVIAEAALRISQLFLIRLLQEVEKHVTDAEDLRSLRYLKQVLTGVVPAHDHGERSFHPDQDKAFQLVDSLRNYIMTGKET